MCVCVFTYIKPHLNHESKGQDESILLCRVPFCPYAATAYRCNRQPVCSVHNLSELTQPLPRRSALTLRTEQAKEYEEECSLTESRCVGFRICSPMWVCTLRNLLKALQSSMGLAMDCGTIEARRIVLCLLLSGIMLLAGSVQSSEDSGAPKENALSRRDALETSPPGRPESRRRNLPSPLFKTCSQPDMPEAPCPQDRGCNGFRLNIEA